MARTGMQRAGIIILILFGWAGSACAQGTLDFFADMQASFEGQPGETESTGHASFTLDESNVLSGYARLSILNYLADLWIEDGGGARIGEPYSIVSTLPEEAMCPCDSVLAEWRLELSQSQVAELMAGEWLIRADSRPNPLMQVTGQILLVPEPGTFTLLIGMGVLLWWGHVAGGKRKGKRHRESEGVTIGCFWGSDCFDEKFSLSGAFILGFISLRNPLSRRSASPLRNAALHSVHCQARAHS